MQALKIVSGGQTGVDRAALDTAIACGLPCGGWCPRGRKAEDGRIPERYPLAEIDGAYPERTRANVRDSDATLILHHGPLSGGTLFTRNCCAEFDRPCLLLDMAATPVDEAARRLEDFVHDNEIVTLNVAGPRASGWPGAYAATVDVLQAWLDLEGGSRLPARESGE